MLSIARAFDGNRALQANIGHCRTQNMTIDAAAKIMADGNQYISQIIAGSTIDPTVIIITHDDNNERHTLTINASMPDVIARMPRALEEHGWAWM
jgi:hypothetical protein